MWRVGWALVAVIVGGALLAPPLFYLGEALVRSGHFNILRDVGFERYVHRSVLLCGLLTLWLSRRPAARRPPTPPWSRLLLGGFCCGAAGVAAFAGALLGAGLLAMQQPLRCSGGLIGWAFAVAAAVGGIEELLFRGALLGALRRHMASTPALLLCSAVFAALHFVRADPHVVAADDVRLFSGLRLLPSLCAPLGHPAPIAGTLLTLFCLGLLLGDLAVRTRSLYLSIGLHAGWVFGLLLVDRCCHLTRPTVWAGSDLRNGLAALLLAGITAVGLRWQVPRLQQP